jgi:hypothetical protein
MSYRFDFIAIAEGKIKGFLSGCGLRGSRTPMAQGIFVGGCRTRNVERMIAAL